MTLYLVGENIDKARSHYGAERGKLIRLVRGVYVDAGDDIDSTVLKHAVRIAKYLYPKAFLSAASSVNLAPTRDGRLFLSGRRKQRTRIRALEIIQNEAPKRPSVHHAVIDDGMGEFRVDVSSIRQRFLEAFRMRSEHASSIDDAMRDAMASRLRDEYGDAEKAATAVWALARENEWHKEGELAERYMRKGRELSQVRNQAGLDLIVAWHGDPIGDLIHDGFEWRWAPKDKKMPPLIRQTTPGKLPPFIVSLLPEGWLESILKAKDERAVLRSGKRYLSNITIAENRRELAALPRDDLLMRLKRFSKGNVFTGAYAGPGRGEIDEGFERNLARIFESDKTPRLSGIQMKAPMHLGEDGNLTPSTDRPFTHILKPAGTSGFEALPIVEWLSLRLGEAAGFEVPDIALVPMPDRMPPALVVERFDVRVGADDKRMLALEDMCSVLDLPTESKYDGTMERIARAVRPLSTSPEDDMLIILKRALFAWLIADGDMHLKNMALLKIAKRSATKFISVRMAPLYDSVSTRVFPGLQHDRMALKLNGKDDKLRRADFRTFAATAGIKASDADAAIEAVVTAMGKALDHVALPKSLNYGVDYQAVAEKMLEIVRKRVTSFT